MSYSAPAHASAADEQGGQIYGLKKGRLLPCKTTSNCISSSSIQSLEKYGRPWAFDGDAKAEYAKLLDALKSDSFLKVVDTDEANRYVRVEAKR
jgi:uncharacterized protein (DUF1499 family)